MGSEPYRFYSLSLSKWLCKEFWQSAGFEQEEFLIALNHRRVFIRGICFLFGWFRIFWGLPLHPSSRGIGKNLKLRVKSFFCLWFFLENNTNKVGWGGWTALWRGRMGFKRFLPALEAVVGSKPMEGETILMSFPAWTTENWCICRTVWEIQKQT